MKLANRVAVVTGANAGLGRAAAVHLVRDKQMRVALVDRIFTARDEIETELGTENVSFHLADVSDKQQISAAFSAVEARWARIHACINAAGIPGTMRMLNTDGIAEAFETFERTLAVNLTGSYLVMAHAAQAMLQNPVPPNAGERGVIINLASVAAMEGDIGHVAYSASKAGVLGMTLPAARELGRYGIRVVSISPGFFDTAMVHSIKESARDRMISKVLFPRRLGKLEEFAALASQILECEYINATSIRIDGGVRL